MQGVDIQGVTFQNIPQEYNGILIFVSVLGDKRNETIIETG